MSAAPLPVVTGNTGNPLLDNPTLKAALAQQMAQQQPAGNPPPMPAPGAVQSSPSIGPAPMPSGSPTPNLPAPSKAQITAPQGTVEGDENKRAQLLQQGSGISRIAHNIEGTQFGQDHPVLGKIGGNLLQGLARVGDIGLSLTGPGRIAESMIPGTAGFHAAQLRNTDTALTQDEGNREKEAQTANFNADVPLKQAQTEAALNPQPKPKEESWHELPGYTDPNGEPLEIEANSGQTRPIQGAKAAPSKAEGEQPLGNVENLNSALENRFQVLNPGKPLPAQFKLAAGATQKDYDRIDKSLESVEKAQGTKAQQEQANAMREQSLEMMRQRLGDAEKKGGKPTADEQRRADLSENLNENLSSLQDIVTRRPELFGPLAGRWAELKQKFGSDDPDLGTLQTIEHQIGMAQISAHGMRSAQGVQAAADSILNQMHSGPRAVLASIDAARNSVKTFQGDVDRATGKTAAPAQSGGPAIGAIEGGYKFKGGDPSDQKNWEKQ